MGDDHVIATMSSSVQSMRIKCHGRLLSMSVVGYIICIHRQSHAHTYTARTCAHRRRRRQPQLPHTLGLASQAQLGPICAIRLIDILVFWLPQTPRVAHLDIKTDNIFLDDADTAKIGTVQQKKLFWIVIY